MATDVKARFATGGTATSATTLAAEQDVDDGSDLTLTGAAATFAQGDDGSCTVQKITLTSGSGDDNSGVTYTVVGTCLLYTSPSPRDGLLSRMPSSA